ncbi:hypothetical protein [Prosthecodimorpha staleyi]|uniref:Glycine zipper domain-containing protein n=1 Tax=Prosthecodimorpha staleyi TaxID=2840188 RepID=A0A947D3G4_9HYPH|nr:hypothetical protein [Prosthecodimorpha staleyi]MBT9289598.1 hypothetical protein [Prosthecodimorpha staleyi]
MRVLFAAAALAASIAMTSAASAHSERTLTGAAIGGGVGAVVAGPPGAIVGGAIGAYVGGPRIRGHKHCYWRHHRKHCYWH